MPNAQWITTTEASRTSQVPRRTIIAAINRGELPAEKLPGLTGAFLIDAANFHTWAAGRKTRAAS